MRVAFVGGTNFVGPVSVRALVDAGHQVAVAHSGAHEAEGLEHVEHLHGSRADLLASEGPVQRWRPDALVDTFAGGATAEKATALTDCARRAGAGQIVAISSIDVYQHCVDAGLANGSGAQVLARDPVPLQESARLRDGPYPGGGPDHDNVAMEAALPRRTPNHGAQAGSDLRVNFSDEDHPWQTSHPVLASDRRLREQLRVTEPDPEAALVETIRWLWQRRDD
jgi:hypothetical protein